MQLLAGGTVENGISTNGGFGWIDGMERGFIRHGEDYAAK
jgi:hypothetical protein